MTTTIAKNLALFAMCLTHTAGLGVYSPSLKGWIAEQDGVVASGGVAGCPAVEPFQVETRNSQLETDSYTAAYGPHGEDWGSTGYNFTPFGWLGGYGVMTLETDTPLRLYLTRHRVYSATLNRFLSADPLGLAGGLNLYMYGEGNPVAYMDPLGLCASSSGFNFAIQFGDYKVGWGDPFLLFTNESWGELGRGSLSTLDGIIPFANPFESYYANQDGSVDFDYKMSRQIAGVSRDILVSAAIPNIGAYVKNPILYELGSTTVSPKTWNAIKGMDTVSRGRYLLDMANGNYLKASLQGFKNIPQFGSTIGTGLTPGGYLLSIGALESVDSYFFNW